jgi:hypothetical protein
MNETVSAPRCGARKFFNGARFVLLTENEVSRSWRKLFNGRPITDEMVVKGEALIDELRPESPLRHRLETELVELRGQCSA